MDGRPFGGAQPLKGVPKREEKMGVLCHFTERVTSEQKHPLASLLLRMLKASSRLFELSALETGKAGSGGGSHVPGELGIINVFLHLKSN